MGAQRRIAPAAIDPASPPSMVNALELSLAAVGWVLESAQAVPK